MQKEPRKELRIVQLLEAPERLAPKAQTQLAHCLDLGEECLSVVIG